MAALSNLDKLESAMKGTAHLASSPLIVYSRVVKQDYVLGGIRLKKGQFITMSGRERTMDPALFESPDSYDGLGFCMPDKLEEHHAKTFRTVDTDILSWRRRRPATSLHILTWGAGRAARPGRLIAGVAVKVFLIQMLDEYDFALVDGKPFEPGVFHEFVYFNPENKILMRRRGDPGPKPGGLVQSTAGVPWTNANSE
ncbi:hypothetical protein NPX13_g28 [Xylaria arbuscula]|uniref:Uncharacterized protein n=1 Tax=Xylaria arbuscula TaxID=114810 RepID=A0A9W8NPE7_9PEZI|nr:hypothetical protein NPX13_g28 [Xylaria arbuscula]